MRQLIFRKSYYDALMKMTPEQRLEAYDAIMAYAFDGEEMETSAGVAPVLSIIFDSIDQDFRRYEAAKEGGEYNG